MSRIALVVGINIYQDPDDNLDFCRADAEDVASLLSSPEYGFDDVSLIVDNEATRYRILEVLGTIGELSPDFFLFYFSGHGVVTDFGPYLVTTDSRPFDEGISLDAYDGIVRRFSSNVRHCLTILDCCHSGAANPGSNVRLVTARDIDSHLNTITESRTLLAACRPEQVSFEYSSLGHGIFTHWLLHGMSGNAADPDGNITVGGLSEYIGRNLERSVDQVMVTKGDSSGRVVLGSGFPPIDRTATPEEDIRRIIDEGQQFLDDYNSQLNLRLNDWTSGGYKAACQALEPTVVWFDSRRERYPELRNNPEFRRLYEAVINRVKQLADIDSGTITTRGTIENKVGGGGFGTVYRVRAEPGNTQLAYKVYHPQDYGQGEKRALFLRGYNAMRQLDHPRVIKVYNFTKCPVGFYMNYIDGPNLRDLPSVVDDPGQLLRLLLLVGETIDHAHSRGVLHRDIKPENILAEYRDGAWLPYLTDFDLAWYSQATQVTKQAWANITYAAPEQLANPRSNAAHKPAVDIYAFGQLAFFTLTGSDPVPLGMADNQRLLGERLERWNIGEAAEQFAEWYAKCTRHNPSERYEEFSSVMNDLLNIELSLRNFESSNFSDESLLYEIAFALSGFGAHRIREGSPEFPSTSGRSSLELNIVGRSQTATTNIVDIEATITLERLAIEGVSNERARAIINSRINDALREFQQVSRRPGSHGVFRTHILIRGVTANVQGLQRARQILRSVLHVIER
jgi:eukaryotic-like serine/threonine-protein kinase